GCRLAPKPTAGVSLWAMIDFELSTKNWVCGEEISSLSCGGSATRSMVSKRFFGLTAAPRPRTGGSEVIRYPRKRRADSEREQRERQVLPRRQPSPTSRR